MGCDQLLGDRLDLLEGTSRLERRSWKTSFPPTDWFPVPTWRTPPTAPCTSSQPVYRPRPFDQVCADSEVSHNAFHLGQERTCVPAVETVKPRPLPAGGQPCAHSCPPPV